jgi:hypothetical protein
LSLPNFILITSSSRIYFLKLNPETNSENKNVDFNYTFVEMSEKIGIFRKFMSNFTPQTQSILNVFTLNPFNYTKFQKNNKKGNLLFLLNENYLKKIEFNVTSKGIEPEVIFFSTYFNYLVDISNKHHQFNNRKVKRKC